jgi:DNA-directed RNA polymerase specialized sigma24 family protein
VSTSFTMLLLEASLERRWRRSLSGVRAWLWQHRRLLDPLFAHADRMPQRVLWVALCHLWRVPELEGPIHQLLDRVIDPLCRRLMPILRTHLGDLPEDIASEIRLTLLTSSLQDRHPVKAVVGYLRVAVRNALRNRIEMAQAASRPALVSITPAPDDPDAEDSFDEALSALAMDPEPPRHASPHRQARRSLDDQGFLDVVARAGIVWRIEQLKPRLRGREAEVFRCCLAGMSRDQTVQTLGILPQTYDTTLRRILEKMSALSD